MDVNTIIKGISQGKLVVDSTEVVEAYFRGDTYGNSRDPAFTNVEDYFGYQPPIKDGYILGNFRNTSKETLKLVMLNDWYSLESGDSIMETRTETNLVKPGQTVIVKIKIPEGLGRVKYEGTPYDGDF